MRARIIKYYKSIIYQALSVNDKNEAMAIENSFRYIFLTFFHFCTCKCVRHVVCKQVSKSATLYNFLQS